MRIKLLSIFIVILIMGCSSSPGERLVTVPESGINEVSSSASDQFLPSGVSEYFPDGKPAGGEGALGLFSLKLIPQSLSAELLSLRKSSLTDVLEVVDITNFLTLAPCTDCAKIKSVSLDADGNLIVSIGIKHPFDVGDPLKPVTGRNRADLHVFNVEGIVVSDADGTSFPGTGETIAGFNLVNVDGYTDYLDPYLDDIFETSATIHPYILHFDDYSQGNFSASNPMGFLNVTTPPPSGNLVMAMGCDYNFQDYVFDVHDTSMEFIYAIGCTYAVSAASKSERFNPEYRIPQHNKKAASEVRVEIVDNNLKGEDTGSSAELAVRVLDISHGVAVDSNLDQMFADSSVAEIMVEIPGVTASPVVVSSPVPVSGSGRDPLNPLNFPVTVTNTAGATEGTYTGIVKVLDSYSPGLNGSPLLNGRDGIKRVNPLDNPLNGTFDIKEFSTYAVFTIDVAVGAILEACFMASPEEVRMEVDPTIDFDGSCSNDPNGYNIVSFEWDFDWDGNPVDFAADETNSIPTTSHTYDEPGTYTVALKVTNDAIPQQTSEIFSDDVIVHGWVLPPVKLTGSDVYATMLWFNDKRIVSTSDGMVHVLVENFTPAWSHRVDYYLCDENGTVSSETLYETNEVVDTGIEVTPSDEVYAFYVKLSGDVCYRVKGASTFGSEVLAVSQSPGNYIETAGYAVNSDGDILVLTAEERPYPEASEIYMALNEGSGFVKTQVGTAYRWISGGGGSGVMIQTDAIADSTGNFHMVWLSKINPDASTETNIYYTYYDGSIHAVTNVNTDSYSGYPVLRVDADDNLWCAFMTNVSSKMAIKPFGNNSFDPGFIVADWIPGTTLPGHCSFDINISNGDIMSVWDVRTSPLWEYSDWSKLFNVSNTPTEIASALEFRIDESATAWQWFPYVTQNADGHWYAIWDDHYNWLFPDPHGDLYFAMYY